MKKYIGIMVLLLFLGATMAGQSNSIDGESLFKSRCGQCHASGGKAPIFAPVKYAAVQWERFFKRNKHKRKTDISDKVSPKEIALIKQYLIDHAADSDRPIAAGLR